MRQIPRSEGKNNRGQLKNRRRDRNLHALQNHKILLFLHQRAVPTIGQLDYSVDTANHDARVGEAQSGEKPSDSRMRGLGRSPVPILLSDAEVVVNCCNGKQQ